MKNSKKDFTLRNMMPLTYALIMREEQEEKHMPSPKDTGGPIVKTGPTAGKVRSRNKNGQYRRKRSDAGVPRGSRNTDIVDVALDIIEGIIKK